MPEINPRILQIIFVGLLCILPLSGQAVVETYHFATTEQEVSYQKLVNELRCLVCQNQSLADSNAELALDMRRKTYEMISAGKTEAEVADFMVTRYGDFVMYRPPLKLLTVVLWFGPMLLLGLALIIVVSYLRKQKKTKKILAVSAQQQQQAHKLLDE